MPRETSPSTCTLVMEINVGNQALDKMFFPISRRSVSLKKNKIKVTDDFESSFIKKIWQASSKVAEDYIHVDLPILKRLHPSIDLSTSHGSFSFGVFNAAKDIAGEGTNSKDILMKNGGWIVVPPSSRLSKKDSCYPSPSDANAVACSMITLLGKMQSGGVYNLKKVVIPKHIKGGLEIESRDVEGKLKALGAITGKETQIPDEAYSVSTYIDYPFYLWVKTEDKDEKGLKLFKNEMEQAGIGKSSRILTYDDFKTWASNIMNEGKGNVAREIEFQLDTSIPPSSTFIKQDHVKPVNGIKKQINSACTSPIVVLVDHEERIVPVETMKGKRKMARTIADVVKGVDPASMKKWKWSCVDGKRNGDVAIIPKLTRVKRSLDTKKTGKVHSVTRESIDASIRDVAKTAWNAMVKSAIDHDPKYRGKTAEEIGTSIMARSRIISGKSKASAFERHLFAGGDLLSSDASIEIDAPMMTTNTSSKGKSGLTGELNDLIKDDIIVGVETDFKELGKKC